MDSIELFNITISELIVFVILALAFLRIDDFQRIYRWGGRQLRKIFSSDFWRSVREGSRYIRDFPNRMMREAGIEDLQKDSSGIDFSIPIQPRDENHTGAASGGAADDAPPFAGSGTAPAEHVLWGPPIPPEKPFPARLDEDSDGVHRPAGAAFE